jgi:plastocyanin
MNMKILSIFLLFCLSFPIAFGAIHSVTMPGNLFSPDTLQISVKDTVRWINTDIRLHTTTSGVNGTPNGLWNSGTMNSGDSFSFIFASAGNFPYYCTFHYLMGMNGLIIVNTVDVKETSRTLKPAVIIKNYPNPFINNLTFNFELKDAGKVIIKIFDALGQPVKNIVVSSMTAGIHSIVWDGTDFIGKPVQNGLYFFRMNLNGANYTGKILRAN